MRTIKAGSRVAFSSKANEGKGTVVEVYARRTGEWVKVKTKDHPLGVVTVRRSQVS